MKITCIYIFLFLFLFYCKQGLEKQRNLISKENKIVQQDSAIIFLNNFYTEYIKTGTKIPESINELNFLKEKYLSKKFLKRIKNENLDYDPIINAQDFDNKWIETLEISPLYKGEIYKVCYSYKDFQGNHSVCIKIILIKNKESYLIDSIEVYASNNSKKKDIKTIWEGVYDYLAYDKSNLKNEYKIYINSSNNINVLYILDKDSIKYYTAINLTKDETKIALPLFPEKKSNFMIVSFLNQYNLHKNQNMFTKKASN